jgi:hypothetical protein
MMRLLVACALAGLCALSPIGVAADGPPQVARPMLSGAWSMNKSLGTAPGSVGMPDDDGEMGGPGRRGGGPGGGGPGGGPGGGMGGRGGGFPGGGGGMRGRPDDGKRREDMAARRELMHELMQLPPRVTIAQDGDKVTFIEPDGVVRTYLANDKVEKHQLQNGTIETKSRWEADALVMELKPNGGMTITRRFAVRGDPRQLEVTTTMDRGPKDAKRIAVYDGVDDGTGHGVQ